MLLALVWVWNSFTAVRLAQDQLRQAQSDAISIEQLSHEFLMWKEAIQQQQSYQPHYTEPLLEHVTKTAAHHTLTLADISTSGEQRLSARVEGATFEQAVRWLYDLQKDSAARIGNTTFQRSQEPGKVNVQTTLFRE